MEKSEKLKAFWKKRIPSILFFALAALILLLSSTLLFGSSGADIFLALMLWSLPLFLH